MKSSVLYKSDNNIEKKLREYEKQNKNIKNINNFKFSPIKKLDKYSNKNQLNLKTKTTRAKFNHPYILVYDRNFHDYEQLLTDFTNTHKGNLYWAIKLRANKKGLNVPNKNSKNKNIKSQNINNKNSKEKPKGLNLTQNFKEPKFYNEDLEKFKLRQKKNKRPLSSILNPNFNNIRHLFINKNSFRSKEFGASLRNYSPIKSGKDKLKVKWDNYIRPNKEDSHLTRFLLPKTNEGKQNLKKLEKRMYRPYKVMFKDVMIGEDTIKQKILTPKKDFTYDGIGEHLNMINYHSKYRVRNTSQGEEIFKNGTNSICLYELGLRNYKSISNQKK